MTNEQIDRRRDDNLQTALTESQIETMTEGEFRKAIFKQLVAINNKVDPMYGVFTSVNGFNSVTVLIFKILVGLGTLIGAIYVIARFIVNAGRPQ